MNLADKANVLYIVKNAKSLTPDDAIICEYGVWKAVIRKTADAYNNKYLVKATNEQDSSSLLQRYPSVSEAMLDILNAFMPTDGRNKMRFATIDNYLSSPYITPSLYHFTEADGFISIRKISIKRETHDFYFAEKTSIRKSELNTLRSNGDMYSLEADKDDYIRCLTNRIEDKIALNYEAIARERERLEIIKKQKGALYG